MLSLRRLNLFKLAAALVSLGLLAVVAWYILELAEQRAAQQYRQLALNQLVHRIQGELTGSGDLAGIEASMPRRLVELGLHGSANLQRVTVTGTTQPGNVVLPVAGTGLTLVYRPAARTAGNDLGVYLAASAAGIALLLAVAISLAQRSGQRALHRDIHVVARMFKDIRDGVVHEHYPTRLAEFQELSRYVSRYATKLVRERRRLQDMGLTDHLSRLPNRRAMDQRLEQLFVQSGTGHPMSLLLIDVDHFKQVNDNFGHDAGDLLIERFATALKMQLRDTDFIARMGGDEFCVVFPYTPLETACELAARLRKRMPRSLELKPGATYMVSWTGGLAAMETTDTHHDQLLWRADKALLMAKQAGRNRSYFYRSDSVPKQA